MPLKVVGLSAVSALRPEIGGGLSRSSPGKCCMVLQHRETPGAGYISPNLKGAAGKRSSWSPKRCAIISGLGTTSFQPLHISSSELHRARRWHPKCFPQLQVEKWALLIVLFPPRETSCPFRTCASLGQQSGEGWKGFCRDHFTSNKVPSFQTDNDLFLCLPGYSRTI